MYKDIPEDVEDEKRSKVLEIINRIMKNLLEIIDIMFGTKPPEAKT